MKDLMVRTHTFAMLTSRLVAIVVFAALLFAVPSHAALAATAPSLGTASGFTVLSAAPGGGGAVTCTDSIITGGDVGSSGLPAAVVQTRCSITGAIIAPVNAGVLADFNNAYNALIGVPCDFPPLTGTLAGITLTPGVYCFDAAATLTGILTLNGGPNDIWIFKIGTAAVGALTGTNFSVVMANGGQPCNVYWWVEAAATMTTSDFKGTILAGAAITVTGGTFTGRALAKAAVTFTDVVPATGCGGGSSPPPGPCPNNGNLLLGGATNLAVFGLTGADITFGSGATTINGNVALGPHTTGSLIKATINGNLFKDPTSTVGISAKDLKVTGTTTFPDLSGAVTDALNASTFWASQTATQTFGNITTSTTITGNGGLNIINVSSINMVGGTLTLVGTASDIFIFNVTGDFILNGTQMVLSGAVNNILWNFPTAGADIKISKPVGVAFGTFLAPLRGILLDKAQLTGAIISGGKILVHSGALICP